MKTLVQSSFGSARQARQRDQSRRERVLREALQETSTAYGAISQDASIYATAKKMS